MRFVRDVIQKPRSLEGSNPSYRQTIRFPTQVAAIPPVRLAPAASRVLSQCDPVANGIDLSLLEHVSPIEWDNVVLYGQYIIDRKLVRHRLRIKGVGLSV